MGACSRPTRLEIVAGVGDPGSGLTEAGYSTSARTRFNGRARLPIAIRWFLPSFNGVTPVQTHAENWLEPMTVAFTESPPRRRMYRAVRQHVDLKLVCVSDLEMPDVNPALYNQAGRAAQPVSRPGRLLNVRV